MNTKGQGALEYLLLIGGAVIVAAVVIALVTNLTATGGTTTQSRNADALCAPIPENRCGTVAGSSAQDPDGSGSMVVADCIFDATLDRCKAV